MFKSVVNQKLWPHLTSKFSQPFWKNNLAFFSKEKTKKPDFWNKLKNVFTKNKENEELNDRQDKKNLKRKIGGNEDLEGEYLNVNESPETMIKLFQVNTLIDDFSEAKTRESIKPYEIKDFKDKVDPEIQFVMDYLRISLKKTKLEKFINENNLTFEKDLKPHFEKLINEYDFTRDYLRIIYIKNSGFFSRTMKSLENLNNSRKYLIDKFGFSSKEVAEIITSKTRVGLAGLSTLENSVNKLKDFLGYTDEELKKMIFDFPFVLTLDENIYKKSYKFLHLYLKISKEDFKQIAKSSPLVLIRDPFDLLKLLREVSRYKAIKNEDWIKAFKATPFSLSLNNVSLKHLFSNFNKIGIRSRELMNMIHEFPELIIANRFHLIQKKFKLFEKLGMDAPYIRYLVKKYPFLLLKSYNSYVNKIFYFKEIYEDLDIQDSEVFPFIFLFDLKKDIKPRLEIMKKHDLEFNLKEAFELKPEEFIEKIGSTMEEWNEIANSSYPLYERDIVFRYRKFYQR